jgi:2-ketocyclohexanecarboxyl-CoA hydrolase
MTIFSDLLYGTDRGVATITINRPSRLNALTGTTLSELGAALRLAQEDRSAGVIVLTGAGDRAFCAGGDIAWEAEGGLETTDYQLGRQLVECPKPVIARVDGYAIGAGNHIAYFCDFTIASEGSVFGQSGPRFAATPGGYTTAHLAAILGHKRAREMEMLCRQYSARQALDWGLVNAIVPRARLETVVREWCDELLALSPTALATVKASFRQAMQPYIGLTLAQVLKEVRPDFFTSGEQQEGAAAFAEKRAPDFSRWR